MTVWHAGFIWDDDSHLTENACVVGPLGFRGIWTTAEGYYFPLVTSTLWVVHAVFGLNPLPYHLLNVALHATNGVLLWRVLRRLDIPGSWLGALLWTLHPVQVESVAWISELKNTQSALFYLLAIWFYIGWVRAGVGSDGERTRGPRVPTWNYVAALAYGIAAVLSKSSTVMLPVVLLLCAMWARRGGERSPRPALGIREWASVLPFVALSAIAAGWTIWEQKFHSPAIGVEWNLRVAQRFIVAGKDIWFYVGKLVWPHPLIFIYPRWTADAGNALSYLPAIGVVAGLIALWRWRARTWPILFATTYFVVSLFPVLGFFNVYFFRYSYVGDHFQYLASMGPLALIGATMFQVCRSVASRVRFPSAGRAAPAEPNRSRQMELRAMPAAAVLVGGLVLTLTLLTWRQAQTYRDNETLFRSVIARNPRSAMAHNNLALELAKSSQSQNEALAEFRTGLRLSPDSAEIHYNLANSLKKVPGGLPEAIEHYETAVRLKPDYAEAHNNLALALEQVPGRLNDVLAHYEAALRYNPENARAHNNLGVVLAALPDRAEEAIRHYEAALRLQPDYAMAHKNLADVLGAFPNRRNEAIAHYERALALKPDLAEAHFGLANVLQGEHGREADAATHYEEALRLRPDYAEAHNNLGILLARQERLDEAERHWRRAAELAPNYEDPRRNLELLRRQRVRTRGE